MNSTDKLIFELHTQLIEKERTINDLNDLLHKANDEVVSYTNCCIDLQQRFDDLLEAHKIQEEILEEKEQRIDKAIEYIKENTFSVLDKEDNLYKDMIYKNKLLEILGDKK